MDTTTRERTSDRTGKPRKHGADVRTINLALQGGGAHGAFTWGVLDRLLEDERIAFEGVSRHQRRRHECGGAGLWPGRRRPRRRAQGARQFLAAGQPCRGPRSAAAAPLDRMTHNRVAGQFAGVHDAST